MLGGMFNAAKQCVRARWRNQPLLQLAYSLSSTVTQQPVLFSVSLMQNRPNTNTIPSAVAVSSIFAVTAVLVASEDGGRCCSQEEGEEVPRFHICNAAAVNWKEEIKSMGRVIHMKGFNFGIDYNNPECVKAARQLIEYACPLGEKTTLVWDGDELRPDSFMWAVQLALLRRGGGGGGGRPGGWRCGEIQLVCFKKAGDVGVVTETWGALKGWGGGAIRVYTVPDDLNWEQLGAYALGRTGAREAVCLGGGATVAAEARALPRVAFAVWPVGRTGRDGNHQACSLSPQSNGAAVPQNVKFMG